MKIALIGYGKMGKAIEEIAMAKGHEIVLRVTIDNLEDNTEENIRKSDVAIEFTGPDSAFDNIKRCLQAGVPVVSGSTGWLERYEELKQFCLAGGKSFLYASNFSVGVNIFFEINKRLAELMAPHPDYSIRMEEIHHTQKLDAPSGTAVTLAEQILQRVDRKKSWANQLSANPTVLSIVSK